MATHTFSVTLRNDQPVDLPGTKRKIEEAGGTFNYDAAGNGSFGAKGVSGTFKMNGNTVLISITKKPFIVSNGFVEKSIREIFASN